MNRIDNTQVPVDVANKRNGHSQARKLHGARSDCIDGGTPLIVIDTRSLAAPEGETTIMNEERMQILRMIAAGQISAEEGDQLLAALEEGQPEQAQSPARWINVRISDEQSGRQKVNVNIPVALLSVGMRLGARLSGVEGVNVEELIDRVRSGASGKLVDVSGDNGERVEINVQ